MPFAALRVTRSTDLRMVAKVGGNGGVAWKGEGSMRRERSVRGHLERQNVASRTSHFHQRIHWGWGLRHNAESRLLYEGALGGAVVTAIIQQRPCFPGLAGISVLLAISRMVKTLPITLMLSWPGMTAPCRWKRDGRGFLARFICLVSGLWRGCGSGRL
jgi:hypothetical protein